MVYPEIVLQILLENHPELLTINNSSTRPQHRWLFVDREVSIPDSQNNEGRWSVDHLFLDQYGIPTFVEVKVSSNDQIRREVIGQLLDYAANAKKYWPPQTIEQVYIDSFLEKEGNPTEYLQDFLIGQGITTYSGYWEEVKHNLEIGRIRLILLADIIPSECLDIVEFLNTQMASAEIWAIEIEDYVRGNPILVEEISMIESEITIHQVVKPDYDLLYSIAENQAGYFSTSQALEAGYSRERLSDLTKRGQFIRIRRGTYRIRHFPSSRFEDLFIALLQTGPHSVISHESALSVYELSDVIPNMSHVIIPRTGSRRRKGIHLHTNQIRDDEITSREGLTITTPERTIADIIASGISYQHVRQAVIEAIRRGLTNRGKLLQQADRRKGRIAATIERILVEEGL